MKSNDVVCQRLFWMALATFYALTIASCWRGEPTLAKRGGCVLTYALADGQQAVDSEAMCEAIQRRLRLVGTPVSVKALPDQHQHFEITLIGASEKQVASAENWLAHVSGFLEMRIVAQRGRDDEIIESALQANGLETDERWKWVRFDAQRYSPLESQATREIPGQLSEILVLVGPHDLDGTHVSRAIADIDMNTSPCVAITFTAQGAKRATAITTQNGPKTPGSGADLGIIVNGELCSAPRIVGVIDKSAQITGQFTEEQVDEIVQIITVSPFPARLADVPESKRWVGPK